MSDVLHDERERAYEEGREAGRREAWSGDYDYRTLIAEARAAALRDAVEAVKAQKPAMWSNPLDAAQRTAVWMDDATAAIESLGEKP